MTLIRTQGLIKFHGDGFQLGPIDLEVAAGQVLGIVGPNGAGKTTLLRLIWGFLRPDKGSISFFDRQPHLAQVAVRMRAGYVAEAPQFYEWMTARKHLEFVSHFYDRWDRDHAEGLLASFGVDPIEPVRQLSRSARTKLALVSAVGHNPRVILLDEPVAGLDTVSKRDILDFVLRLAKTNNIAVIISSNDPDEVELVADRVLTLNASRNGR